MDTLWDSVAVSDDSGNRDLSGSWSRPGNHKRILAADCGTEYYVKRKLVVLVAQ